MLGLSCIIQGLSCGARTLAVAPRPSFCQACGVLVSPPGIESTSLALQGRCLTTGPPGKSLKWYSVNTYCGKVLSEVWSHLLFTTNLEMLRFRDVNNFSLTNFPNSNSDLPQANATVLPKSLASSTDPGGFILLVGRTGEPLLWLSNSWKMSVQLLPRKIMSQDSHNFHSGFLFFCLDI